MKHATLRAQFASRFATAEKWNQVFPLGTWHGANLAPIGGSINIDMAMLNELVANWQQAGRPPLPIYKTHLHLEEGLDPLTQVELEKSYGYLTDFRVTAQGLEAQTEWTPAGKAIIDAGEFAFWSPEWQPRFKDRRTGETKGWWLSAVALCSNPFFHTMPPVAASADDAGNDGHPNKEQDMFTPEQLKSMKAALKCAEDCSGDDLYAAFEKKMTVTASADKSSETITAAVKTVRDEFDSKLTAANKTIEKLQVEALERDVDAMISKLKSGDGKTGRAVPEAIRASAMVLAKSAATKEEGLKAAADLLEALPLTVPMQAVGIDGKPSVKPSKEEANAKLQAAAAELRVAQKLGEVESLTAAMKAHPDLAIIASA